MEKIVMSKKITIELNYWEVKTVVSALRNHRNGRERHIKRKPVIPNMTEPDFRKLIVQNCESVLSKIDTQMPHKGSDTNEYARSAKRHPDQAKDNDE